MLPKIKLNSLVRYFLPDLLAFKSMTQLTLLLLVYSKLDSHLLSGFQSDSPDEVLGTGYGYWVRTTTGNNHLFLFPGQYERSTPCLRLCFMSSKFIRIPVPTLGTLDLLPHCIFWYFLLSEDGTTGFDKLQCLIIMLFFLAIPSLCHSRECRKGGLLFTIGGNAH